MIATSRSVPAKRPYCGSTAKLPGVLPSKRTASTGPRAAPRPAVVSCCFISKSIRDSAIMPRRWRKLLGCLALIFGLAAGGPAAAHGFGQRYDLPIPLSFYIWSAGATVALSFVGFGLFLRVENRLLTWHIDWQAKGRLVEALAAVPRVLAIGMLLLVIVAGLFGNQDPIRNIAPVMIWIVGWVGLAFLSVLLGDVWRLVNPWNAVFALAEVCWRRVRADAVLSFGRTYPEWLAAWPAFLLLVVFAWMELVWSGRNDPAALAIALAAYSALTVLGMALFGRQKWRAQGEMFTLAFIDPERFARYPRRQSGRRPRNRETADRIEFLADRREAGMVNALGNDINAKSWSKGPDLPTARGALTATAHENKIYA